MSASREKRERREQGSVAPVQQNQSARKGMSRGLKTALISVCAVVVVAVVVFCYMVTSGFFTRNLTAATVGTHKLTPAMVNYYYQYSLQQMSSYASYFGLDSTDSLADVVYDEETGKTWGDVLLEEALADAAQVYAVYDEAVANGAELSETDQATITSNLTMLETYASLYGASNADAYLAGTYGAGCTTKSFREYMTVNLLSENYSQQIYDGLTYSAEELAAEYEANATDYNTYTYRQFIVSDSLVTGDSETELSDEELSEQKQAIATVIADAGLYNEQGFIDAVYENASEDSKETYADESATLRSYLGSSISDDVLAWLADDARQEGDTAALEISGSWYAIYYISCDVNDYALPNVREISFSATDTSDETAMSDARAQAEAVLADYEAGEQTAEAFAALALMQTGDSTSADLTENVTPTSISEDYWAWAFDASRTTGDVAVVETTSGYSLVYFDGLGDIYRDVLADSTLRTNDYNTWYSGLTDDASYDLNSFGMRFVSK